MIVKQPKRAGLAALAGTLMVLAGACGDAGTDESAMVDTTTAAPAAAAGDMAAGGVISDAEIVSQVTAANASELSASSIAADRATNAQVREFAQRMIDEHQAAQGQVDSLAVRMGVTAEVPAMDTLAQAFEQRREALEGLSGAEFDREYMAMQVEMHQSTLDMLNQSMSATQNSDLQATLQALIPTVQSHLDQAREIHQGLGQG